LKAPILTGACGTPAELTLLVLREIIQLLFYPKSGIVFEGVDLNILQHFRPFDDYASSGRSEKKKVIRRAKIEYFHGFLAGFHKILRNMVQ
jgi:hypothetical protein